MTTPSETIHGSGPFPGIKDQVVHLVQQSDRSTISFSPDVQDGFYHSYQCDLYGGIYGQKAFVCGERYRGCIDLITHLPEKTTCPKCKENKP